MTINITEQYDPYENAIAERINRNLKYEYGLIEIIKNTSITQKITKQAVYINPNIGTGIFGVENAYSILKRAHFGTQR